MTRPNAPSRKRKASTLPEGPFGLERIDRETLQDKTYKQLRTALMSGRFPPGEAMTVRALAELLGTSTTPVREAYWRLIAAGALELLPNGSVCVPPITRQRFDEITRVRLLLEGQATEWAASRIGSQKIAALKRLETTMRRSIDDKHDFKAFLGANEEFHQTLYRAAGLQPLTQLIESLWLQIGPFLNILETNVVSVRRANDHHGTIVRALAAGDGLAARYAVEADIREAAERIVASIPET